jgi:ADP-heptose:LPS heptosyltransferase
VIRPAVLVLRALGIGDLVTAVPALRALRAARPGETIALAAPAWLAPLVELTGAVDRHIPVEDLTPRPPGAGPAGWGAATTPLPRAREAVNLHGSGPQSHRLLMAASPGRLMGFACPAAGHRDGPEWMNQEHEVDRWCRLLRWYGIPSDPDDLDLLPPSPRGAPVPAGATVVHVGAKAPARRWPVDRFAAVAQALAAAGHRVVVTGSAADLPRAARVARRAGLPGPAVYAGRTGLGQLAALVAGARLVVSGDTGVAHLATGYRVPSVVLFGPEPPARWGPPRDRPWHRVLWPGSADHQVGTAHSQIGSVGGHVAAITVAEVLSAVSAVARAGPPGVRRPETVAPGRVPDAAAAQ